jgi:hypothetical protein
VKAIAEQHQIPIYQFNHKERKDDVANRIRQQRGVRDGIVFIGLAQEKAQAFQGKKIDVQFQFTRDKSVYFNHYYFYIDDADFGPLFTVRSAAHTIFKAHTSRFRSILVTTLAELLEPLSFEVGARTE